MTDKKISALTAATTPLAGTEVLPIVQSGNTDKVAVSDLTAGRTVSMLAFDAVNSSSAVNYSTIENRFHQAALIPGAGLKLQLGDVSEPNKWCSVEAVSASAYEGTGDLVLRAYNGGLFGGVPTELYRVAGDGNKIPVNLIFTTAAKGINFTANTPAAGMTSQLLNWYEEGTWTPNQGAGLTVVGAFSSSGTYTRIGRQVTVRGQVIGATSVVVSAAGVISSNLPFTSAVSHAGSMFNAAVNASGVVQITSASVVAAAAIAATPNITFTATYQV